MDWTKETSVAVIETMLPRAKIALRIKTDEFNQEITDIIMAGYDDLEASGILVEENALTPMVTRAVLTYVRYHFGDPDNPDKLKKAYDEQKAQLRTTTGYADWETEGS